MAMTPGDRCISYKLRANIAWKQHRQREAIADLRQALDLAEQQRLRAAGSEQERPGAFGQFSSAFETMVAWQAELGDMTEALANMERGRARSLLDEMALAGADINAGRSGAEREALRERELELKRAISSLEEQLNNPSLKLDSADRKEIEAALAEARGKLLEHYMDERNSSPVYRNRLSAGAGPPRLSQLRRELVREDGLLLINLLGQEASYVLSLGGTEERITKLTVDEAAAKVLKIDAGPLTAARLRRALFNDAGTGVMQQLVEPERAMQATGQLAALWPVLVPEPDRKAITNRQLRRLIIVPDGSLALLPLETLVVTNDREPTYLLDVAPPIQYGPSATMLYNLSLSRAQVDGAPTETVLTLGDPAYTETASAGPTTNALNESRTAARYAGIGGASYTWRATAWSIRGRSLPPLDPG